MAGGFRIDEHGANEVVISFRQLRSHVKDVVAEGLYEGADAAVEHAKSIARSKLHTRTGDLVGSIERYRRGNRVYVRDTARHRGYAYPGRFEFRDKDFLRPGAEAASQELASGVDHALDAAHSRAF